MISFRLFRFFILLFITLLLTTSAYSQSVITKLTSFIHGDSAIIRLVQFLNQDTGYAIGLYDNSNGGFLAKTINGGYNWDTREIDFDAVYGMIFFNSYEGIICGEKLNKGVIQITTNSGINWSKYFFEDTSALLDIFFVNENIGYVTCKFSNGFKIYKTNNRGSNWELLTKSKVEDMFVVNFSNGVGIVLGNNQTGGYILVTKNGGLEWSEVNIPYSHIYSGQVISANKLIVCGYNINHNGLILKSIDYGENWYKLWESEDSFSSVTKIFFPSTEIGYAIGNGFEGGFILKTSDSGRSWIKENIGFTPTCMYVIDEKNCFIGTRGGALLKIATKVN